MGTKLTAQKVAELVQDAIPKLAYELPNDVLTGLELAYSLETHPRGKDLLGQLIENAAIAREEQVPLCQDTGTVWVCLEVGPDQIIPGNIFSEVNNAVAYAYQKAHLRKSVVFDALFDRINTQNNTPAFCEIKLSDTPGIAHLHIMLKGGGSDNASRITMLTPGASRQGVVEEVLQCIVEKGANVCPPLIIGVGIGSTFDKVAGLAKQALMRPIGTPAADERSSIFEAGLLSLVNATGIGPGGLGGDTTALAVHVKTAPCHIAALPLAINVGCSAMRRVTIEL